jgi:hypothetical protein
MDGFEGHTGAQRTTARDDGDEDRVHLYAKVVAPGRARDLQRKLSRSYEHHENGNADTHRHA